MAGVLDHSRSGQSLIESCLIVTLVCLILFGVFQISQLFAAQEVLDYAAGRGARARTVGFNKFMVDKTVRVGAIPNAGRMLNPTYQGGPAVEHALEAARIPLYLGGENGAMLEAILDYKEWDTIPSGTAILLGNGTLQYSIKQNVPLKFPFHHAFYDGDVVPMEGTVTLDEHCSLYMDTSDDWEL